MRGEQNGEKLVTKIEVQDAQHDLESLNIGSASK
jgi:hypothetical protein